MVVPIFILAFHGDACLSSTTTTMLSYAFPVVFGHTGKWLAMAIDQLGRVTCPAARKRNEAWKKSVSDWFEITSANLNLGAYSLRVRPLPRFLKHPLRKVSGLTIWPRKSNHTRREINVHEWYAVFIATIIASLKNLISTLQSPFGVEHCSHNPST